jgi:acetoin utilization deacetylase AcuC-like enzyme
MIYDWDIHHGNGTQHAFYDMPEVLYVSTHQYPYYPGTGALDETGIKAGEGYTVNIPLAGGQTDADYLLLIDQVLAPLARAYKPQFIIVSAGYDIYGNDPLGTMDVTPAGFGKMTARLKQLAEELCRGRLLLALEGGYHIDGCAQAVHHTINALAGHSSQLYDGSADTHSPSSSYVGRVIKEVYRMQAHTWPIFKP